MMTSMAHHRFVDAQCRTDDVRRTKCNHTGIWKCTRYDGRRTTDKNAITQGFGNMQGTTDDVRRTKSNHTRIWKYARYDGRRSTDKMQSHKYQQFPVMELCPFYVNNDSLKILS